MLTLNVKLGKEFLGVKLMLTMPMELTRPL